MSDTPRTDAAMDDGWSGDAWLVPVEFARSLERENEVLRGQLINCANLLHRLKRNGYASDALAADKAIESANAALYETQPK